MVVDPYGKKYSNFAGGTGLVATTRIRVKFTSRLFWSHSFTRSGYGSSQGVGSKTLPGGANYQVLVTDPPILTMVPTAARTITLPLETISNGLQFTFVNQAATALNITLAGSGASLVGTATVGQGKTALVQCDGTNWYSVVSA